MTRNELPPSKDYTKRDSYWEMKFLVAQSYIWGRKDAGEQRDPNDDFRFAEAYADAYWEFNRHQRVYMPSIGAALISHDAGEAI
jgi:hypothetical protein